MRRLAAIACMLALGIGASSARAAAVTPVEGIWHATTSAGLPVTFEVSGSQILNPHFRYRWGFCGSVDSEPFILPTPIEADGHWRHEEGRGAWVEATFTAPDRAEGSVNTPGRMTPSCPATHATFVAEPGPPPPPPKTFVVDDVRSGHLAEEPRRMVLAGGRVRIFELDEWFEYGEPRPIAGGRALLRRCRHCPNPEVRRPKAFIYLSHLTARNGYRVYERIRWVFRGAVPRGFAHHGSVLLE
jgi:hypothetical protein